LDTFETLTDPNFTYVYDKVSCMKGAYFAHVVFCYLVFLSGIFCCEYKDWGRGSGSGCHLQPPAGTCGRARSASVLHTRQLHGDRPHRINYMPRMHPLFARQQQLTGTDLTASHAAADNAALLLGPCVPTPHDLVIDNSRTQLSSPQSAATDHNLSAVLLCCCQLSRGSFPSSSGHMCGGAGPTSSPCCGPQVCVASLIRM
jgi:hypothetical protein